MTSPKKQEVDALPPRTTKEFRDAYARLNPQQKIAVDTIEGPIMVIAGPGTGKTQTLAMRAANILEHTHMRPSNILCLTFTKSGATAMRDRLRSLIGSDAYGITIDTIHGFCNTVISQYADAFEEWSTLEQISDIERYRAINGIIDHLMPDFTLVSKKNPYTRTRQIIDRISQLKREGLVDRNTLLSIADRYDQEMQDKSREGTKQHAKNLRAAKKFRDFLMVYFRYQEMLTETGRYDYDDMILKVSAALREEDWLLATLQERYQYILLDEIQDTNGAQWEFVNLLTEDPTGSAKPNLFVVGDDDQAIYRFQGAELKNILSFHNRFPEAPIITLTESYRSTQSILDAAMQLVSHNDERLVGKVDGIEKNLQSAHSAEGTSPSLLRPPSDMAEPWLIADLIEERIGNGILPEEIAVIVRTNNELRTIYDVLRSRGISVEMTGKVDLLTHPLIASALNMLFAIENPKECSSFAHAIAAPCFGICAFDYATVFKLRREKKILLMDLITALGQGELTDLKLRDRNKVILAGEFILDLYQQKTSLTIIEVLERVLRSSGLLTSSEGEIDVIDVAVAQEFFDRIKSRAYEQPDFTLEKFLRDVSEYYMHPEYRDLRLTYSLPHLTDKGIKLMTAHKSKGLEFSTVIITNFREGHWDGRRNPSGVSVPEHLLFGIESNRKKYEQGQDERRVAYVAMTRAKNELIFTCPAEMSTGDRLKTVSPSSYFAEAGKLPEKHRGIREPERASTLIAPVIRNYEEERRAYLTEEVRNFSLSASSLNDFLLDPGLFCEKHLLHFPEARNPVYAYGNAIHHVLAEWGNSVKKGESMSREDVLAFFAAHLLKREVVSPKEHARLLRLGEETLNAFYETALAGSSPVIYEIEYKISTHLGDIPINGKIDRIDLAALNDSHAIIYDYKTGKPKSPAEIESMGYRRQLVFYDLMIRQALPHLNPQEYILSFVGEEEEGPINRSYIFSDSDRKELRELIQIVWGKIIALDFTAI